MFFQGEKGGGGAATTSGAGGDAGDDCYSDYDNSITVMCQSMSVSAVHFVWLLRTQI